MERQKQVRKVTIHSLTIKTKWKNGEYLKKSRLPKDEGKFTQRRKKSELHVGGITQNHILKLKQIRKKDLQRNQGKLQFYLQKTMIRMTASQSLSWKPEHN